MNGNTYLTKINHVENSFSDLTLPALNSSNTCSFFIFHVIKIAINKLPIGSIKLLTKKSAVSKMFLPNTVTFFKTPNDNAEGNPTRKTIPPANIADLGRFSCFSFVRAATIISSSEKDDVNVANKNNSKNSAKNTDPNGTCSNTCGNTTKSNPGPSVGSMPNANTAGKIASPASNDTTRFKIEMEPADFVKLMSFPKYELYVTMQDKPTHKEKKDCPNAYRTDVPVIALKSGFKKNSIPSVAPSRVKERTTIIKKQINNKGIIYLFARSIPF